MAFLNPYLFAQGVVDFLPQAGLLEASEVAVDDIPGRQVMGPQTPRTTGTQLIDNGVQDFPIGIHARATCFAASFRLGQVDGDYGVLAVG